MLNFRLPVHVSYLFTITSFYKIDFSPAFLKETKNSAISLSKDLTNRPQMQKLQKQCQKKVDRAKSRIEKLLTNYANEQINAVQNAVNNFMNKNN